MHGFGFVGALAEIGLPQQAITLALIFFNIGAEVVQLMFVASMIVVSLLLQYLKQEKLIHKAQMLVSYGLYWWAFFFLGV